MILRRSSEADLPALQALWQEVFGDPPAFTSKFYEAFGPDSAIVAVEEEKVVAMIHPLPVALAQNRKYSFGVYIYALATDPHYRGRGIASRLLAEAERLPFSRIPTLLNAETAGLTERSSLSPTFALLIPGEESLFDYYHTRGYNRSACVISQTSPDYCSHLAKGLEDQPIFLKPYEFFAFSEHMWEPVPPPTERGLWKALTLHLTEQTPILSHFMQ